MENVISAEQICSGADYVNDKDCLYYGLEYKLLLVGERK